MASITLKGSAVKTVGELPKVGDKAPGFGLVAGDLSETDLAAYAGKKVVLNIFPSIDTGVCADSVRRVHAGGGGRGGAGWGERVWSGGVGGRFKKKCGQVV